MTKKIDTDLLALKQAAKALKRSSNKRMLQANMEFLYDYFIRRPSADLPSHLRHLF